MIDIKITDILLQPDVAKAFCSTEQAGGTVVFIGTTRNNTKGRQVVKLEFEAYRSMAEKEMKKIADTVVQRWDALRVAIHHREGTVYPGEIAVVIAVATSHRAEAFEACKYAIDTLKETVPIWKKEIFEDGEIWVSAHP